MQRDPLSGVTDNVPALRPSRTPCKMTVMAASELTLHDRLGALSSWRWWGDDDGGVLRKSVNV